MGLAQAFTKAVREPLAVIAILVIVIFQLVWLEQPLAPILVSILLFYRGLTVFWRYRALADRFVEDGCRRDGAR
jgi:hypothetical protein